MGISATQFFNGSRNGKAMVAMMCHRRDADTGASIADVELVRDICEWLVDVYRKDIAASAVQQGATIEQANLRAANFTLGLMTAAESIRDGNCESVAMDIIDKCFKRFYEQGRPQYETAMAWFADRLREKIKSLPGERDF